MCNNYAMFTTSEALTRLRMEWERTMRNVPPLYLYPDYLAPIVRELDGRRVVSLARWGLPSLKDRRASKGAPISATLVGRLEGLPRRRAPLPLRFGPTADGGSVETGPGPLRLLAAPPAQASLLLRSVALPVGSEGRALL